LFTTRKELRQTLRHNLCYYQSMRHKVLSLLESKRLSFPYGDFSLFPCGVLMPVL
jgi:hypothetical protein